MQEAPESCPDEFVVQDMGKYAVLYYPEGRRLHVLNETGAQILRLLRDGVSTDEIVQLLLGKYDTDEERLRTDISNFVQGLSERGFDALIAPCPARQGVVQEDA